MTLSPLVLLALAAAAAPAAPAAAPARQAAPRLADLRFPPLPAFVTPKPERVVLANGLVLLLLPDRDLPLVRGTALVRTGRRLEPADKIGLAGLVGTVLRTGGTRRRAPDAIDDLLEGIGAQLETSAGTSQGRASFNCLSQDLDTVLGLLAEVLREPAFAADRLEVARAQAKAAIARRNDNPQQIASREFARLVYGRDSVYARIPEHATVDAVTRDDLVAFHQAHFHPNRVLLGLTGDFDPRAARALVERHLGSWAKGPAAEPFRGGWSEPRPGVYAVEKEDVNQSNIYLGHLGITTDHPDYFAVSVLNEVFGGGFSSRLFAELRTRKGLAYAVGGGVGDDYDHPGLLRLLLFTRSGTTVEGIRALLAEVEKIQKEPVGEAELKRAKDTILNSFIFNFDTPGEVLERQLEYEYYGYPADFLDRYRAGIERTTAEDVHRVARAHIDRAKLVYLVLGRSADFGTPLKELGLPVTPVDITIPGAAAAAAGEPDGGGGGE